MAIVAAAIDLVRASSARGWATRRAPSGSSPGSARAGGISIGDVQIQAVPDLGRARRAGRDAAAARRPGVPAVRTTRPGIGFTGIAVAFLGQNNPIGIVFAAILWGVLARGETALQIETEVPREFMIILQGIFIMSVVMTYQVAKRRLLARQLAARRRRSRTRGLAPAGATSSGLAKEDR